MGDQMKVNVRGLLDQEKRDAGPRCATCQWLAARPEDERAEWRFALLRGNGYDAAQIARAMGKVKSSKKAPGRLSVQRHRRDGHLEEA